MFRKLKVILASGQTKHHAGISRVPFKRTDHFEAQPIAVKSDDLLKARGRARDPHLYDRKCL
jgi:hypothetical protein